MAGRSTAVNKTQDVKGHVVQRMRAPGSVDIWVAMALLIIGAVAALSLPEENTTRLVLTLPVIFFAPGYVLIQAIVGGAPPVTARMRHGLLAVGASPALVGLLALATALAPGGFRPTPIIMVVTLGSLAVGLLALYRRGPTRNGRTASPDPARTS